MASAPGDRRSILGRLDSAGRLTAADPELAALQVEAGSHVGDRLALPQITAIARLARKLGIPVARSAIAAGAEHDIDMWVRAVPEGNEIALSIERMTFRPAAPPRLTALLSKDQEEQVEDSRGTWAVDEQLRLIAISPALAKLLGLSPGESVGQPLTRLFRLEEDEDGELPILWALSARQDFTGQKARPRGKAERELMLSGRVANTPDGRFAGFEGQAEVIGAAAESAPFSPLPVDTHLDEALRTPIDRIIDAASRIAEREDGPLAADYADYAADISAAARHLLGVMRSMGGSREVDDERVNVAKLASEAAVLVETAAEERRVLVALETAAPLMARGKRAEVTQILVNLIGNAVRHSPAGGAVAVSFDRKDSEITVNITDNGAGVAPGDQQRIFERFERAGEGEGGAGLGLAISRRLARAMGGDIRLESTPGEGARFTLSLPAA